MLNKININKYLNKKPFCSYRNGSKIICVTFKELKELQGVLIIPSFQTDLCENKVLEMVTSYEENPHHFCSRSLITIAHIIVGSNEEFLVIDGQHRLEMAYHLLDKGLNDTILVALINISSKGELDKIFNDINKDSTKCIINNYEIFEKQIYEELKNYINKDHYFLPKSSSTNKPIYTASEFTDLIIKNNILNNLKSSENSCSQEIYNYLKDKEKIFFNTIEYLEDYHRNKDSYKLCEIKSIEAYSCMFMKNNNFIFWLLDNNIKPRHNYKKRQNIKKSLQKEVWTKEFGSKTSGNCPIYNCTKILSLDITNSWQCGHIVSLNNGGSIDINNLKPICPTCNQSMSDTNWDEWLENKMYKEILDDYFEDSEEIIKCKSINCKNKINSSNFKPYLYKNKKAKPICTSCYNLIK